MERAPVEFLDVEPPPGPEPLDERSGPRRLASTWAVLAAVGAFAAAALVVQEHGGPAPSAVASSSPAPIGRTTSPAPTSTAAAEAAARIVYVGGCNGCLWDPAVPSSVRRAVGAAFPAVRVDEVYTIISAVNGQVFARGVHGWVGRGDFQIDVELGEAAHITGAALQGTRRMATKAHAGYQVTVRTDGIRVPLGRLRTLAANPAMTAAK